MKKMLFWSFLLLFLVMSRFVPAAATGDLGSWCLAQGQLWEGSHGRCLIGPGGEATVSEPLTIDMQQSIDIFIDGLLTNESQIINEGSILSAGRIDNRGQIDSAGTISNNGIFVSEGSVNHSGSFVNRSLLSIDNPPGGEFIADGPLINQGTMIVSGTLRVSETGALSNQGAISNTGTVDAQGTTIHNQKLIQNEGAFQLKFTTFLNHGMVANAGAINNDDSTIYNLCQGTISGTQPVGGVVLLLDACTHLPLVGDG